jgi:hypothetical protein
MRALGIAMRVEVADEIGIADELTAGLEPGDSSRGWERRWEQVQRELERLEAPHTDQLSGDAIHAAHQRLQSFFIQAYHMKDALKAEASSLGLQPKLIEDMITNDPALALVTDLANLDKHYELNKEPRSGAVPAIGKARGIQAGSGKGGWRLEVDIDHAGNRLDGLKVANAAVDAWRRALKQWGLV